MNRFYFRELLTEKMPVFESVLAFNAPVVSENEANAVTQHVLQNPALRSRLLAKQPKQPMSFQGFDNDVERLAMLSADELARLGRIVAASILAEDIANAISREEARDVRLFLGDDIYNYALVRGRYQAGGIRALLAPRVSGMLSERCAQLARGIFEALRSTWSDSLKEQTAETFATMALPGGPALQLDASTQQNLWRFMKKIILRECDKQWTHYFA